MVARDNNVCSNSVGRKWYCGLAISCYLDAKGTGCEGINLLTHWPRCHFCAPVSFTPTRTKNWLPSIKQLDDIRYERTGVWPQVKYYQTSCLRFIFIKMAVRMLSTPITTQSFASRNTWFVLWYQAILRIDVVLKFSLCSVARGLCSVCSYSSALSKFGFYSWRKPAAMFVVRRLDDPQGHSRAGCDEHSYGLVTVVPTLSLAVSFLLHCQVHCYRY